VQFHPNSRQARDACVLIAVESSLIKARECRLIGPAPGSSSGREIGVAANTHATASLVSGTKQYGMTACTPWSRSQTLCFFAAHPSHSTYPCKSQQRVALRRTALLLPQQHDVLMSSGVGKLSGWQSNQSMLFPHLMCRTSAHCCKWGSLLPLHTVPASASHAAKVTKVSCSWCQLLEAKSTLSGAPIATAARSAGSLCLWSSLRGQGAVGAQLRWQQRQKPCMLRCTGAVNQQLQTRQQQAAHRVALVPTQLL
jgi:hypothetical protein